MTTVMSYSGMRHNYQYRTLPGTHAHKLPFTHVLLYMQPKHNYKIKHRGHFKIKAQYLLERGLVPLYYIHVIVCCCWEAVWSFAVVPEADLGQRLGFSEVRWRNGGGRKQEEDEILCRERKLSEIRMLMDGSSSFESSIVYFLHCIHPEKLVLGSCPHRSFYIWHSSSSYTWPKTSTNPFKGVIWEGKTLAISLEDLEHSAPNPSGKTFQKNP